jgi:methyl-accepting chemotaxis protein
VGQIGDVARLISDIAGRTNLLSLNTTIEAARAGDAGKGFAVVASEVKPLANQTARATETVRVQISFIHAVTGEAVSVVDSAGEVIICMNAATSAIAAAIDHQRSTRAWTAAGSCVKCAR